MAKSSMSNVDYATDAYDAADKADCLVLVTEWNQFRSLDLKRIKSLMNTPNFVDLRNVYRPAELESEGFTYSSVGRPDGSAALVSAQEAAE